MSDIPIITIDGPSGSGKGAVCHQLAQKLHWHLLDSGAIYRVLAYAAERAGMSLEDEQALSKLAQTLDLEFSVRGDGSGQALYLGNEDVTVNIRSQECGNAASKIAAYQVVRQALLFRQREFQRPPGLIADGRDMGTVVFPHACLKIFLSASQQERANRRYKQLKEQGFSVNLARLSAEIVERDVRDTGRSQSPLIPAHDAVLIDTTGLSIEQVVEEVLTLAKKAVPGLK